MEFATQAAYKNWANSQWLEFVCSKPDHDQYLYGLMSHIIKGERAWLQRINVIDWNRDLWQQEPKHILLALAADNEVAMRQILLNPLDGRIHITRLNGAVYKPRISDILQHIFYHSENHRGQLASFSAKAGLDYPKIDYMGFSIATGL